MVTANTVLSKVATLAMLPALTLGMFAAPSLAAADEVEGAGVLTVVEVNNVNAGMITNDLAVMSNTGNNAALGGDGGEGGTSGNSNGTAGNGGDGAAGGNGGDAEAASVDEDEPRPAHHDGHHGGHHGCDDGCEDGEAAAIAGDGGAGSNGGAGGDTGNTGDAGNGGNGGEGGVIETGEAIASVAISNELNTNHTEVVVEEDCCGQYNEYYESADEYYERNHESSYEDYDEGRRGVSHDKGYERGSEVSDAQWEVYSKEFVPVTTVVGVNNANIGAVANRGVIAANSGDNAVAGGFGANGGDTGNSNGTAGNGGSGDAGGEGGAATAYSEEGDAYAEGGYGGDAGYGEKGGNTGYTGAGGEGGEGATGGLIVTGRADTLAAIVNVSNRNVTRIQR